MINFRKLLDRIFATKRNHKQGDIVVLDKQVHLVLSVNDTHIRTYVIANNTTRKYPAYEFRKAKEYHTQLTDYVMGDSILKFDIFVFENRFIPFRSVFIDKYRTDWQIKGINCFTNMPEYHKLSEVGKIQYLNTLKI